MANLLDNGIMPCAADGRGVSGNLNPGGTSAVPAIGEYRRELGELIGASIPMIIADENGAVIGMNGLFSERFGYNEGDLRGKSMDLLFIRGGGNIPSVEEQGLREFEADFMMKDGAAAQVLLKCVSRRFHGGNLITACQVEDITERKKAEFRLMELSRAVEQSPASVVITDADGTIEYVNPKFTDLTGYTFEEAIGKNPRILKSGEQPAEYYAVMWRTILSGNEWRGEFHNLKKNGESYWEFASISPIRNSRGDITRFIAVKEDITARKLAESQRESALDALRQSEEALREKNRIMERELSYAQVIIRMLLPSEAPDLPWIKSVYRYIPLDEVGGDFFSFQSSGDGENLGVFIGDVAGHGVSAALFLSMIKSVTERLFRKNGPGPSEYLARLNRELVENMQSYFLTAIYGRFSRIDGQVRFIFAKAGHPTPLLWKRATGEVETFKTKGSILGYFGEQKFEELNVGLRPGDRMFLYTDGVIETEDADGRMLGHDGFSRLIRDCADADIGAQLDGIIASLDGFRGAAARKDDIVLMGFEIV